MSVANSPTNLTATLRNQQISVAFTPGSDGGSPITDYLYSTDGGSTYTSSGTVSSPVVITGLTNGTNYTIELIAQNSIGDSPASSSVSSTPSTDNELPIFFRWRHKFSGV